MATYKEIRGTQIEAVATDPSNPIEGQVWYNTTSNVLKGQAVTSAGSWATGGNLNTARAIQGAAGTYNASLNYGGYTTTEVGITETYNGTNWTEVNDMGTARAAFAAGGTQTSAIAAGGQGPPNGVTNCEIWNGTNWTETTDLNASRRYITGAAAVNTAAIAFGGIPPNPGTGATELWNGSNWTEVNDLTTARRSIASCGTSTAGFSISGYDGESALECEIWNGTNWTEVNDIPSGFGTGAAFGTTTAAVVNANTVTKEWNGTNWAAGTASSTNVSNRACSGTASLGIAAGGEPPPSGVATTEEWTGPGTAQTRTFTDS